jgi:hypothetical protein
VYEVVALPVVALTAAENWNDGGVTCSGANKNMMVTVRAGKQV